MKTRCSTRAYPEACRGRRWTTTIKVQVHRSEFPMPYFQTALFYRFGDFETKADALRAGRSELRKLKAWMAKTGEVPRGRIQF